MAKELTPFICDGLSLGIPNTDATSVSHMDNVLFLDEDGKLHFRDEYVRTLTDVLENPVDSITLEDLATRMRGVFVVDGKLYFKDSTVNRAYSLEEIIGSYKDWKNKLTNGGIFWIGRTQINSSECDNMIIDVQGDPSFSVNTEDGRYFVKDTNGSYSPVATGTKIFSIDQYLLEEDAKSSFSDGTFKRTSTNEWRWHDIPNLSIVIPPVDNDISSHILAKLTVRLIKADTPVVFRLYDSTSGEELDRIAIANDSTDSTEQQITLTHVGDLTPSTESLEQIDCQCPNITQRQLIEEEPAHTIKVQFYVNEILTDDVTVSTTTAAISSGSGCVLDTDTITKYVGVERRIIGLPNSITTEPIVNSSIDVILYNTEQTDSVGRKSGTVEFANKDIMTIKFTKAFSDANYSVTLSCNKNINLWHTNKKPTGFTIRAEKKFTGTVDWSALKLKFEGDA